MKSLSRYSMDAMSRLTSRRLRELGAHDRRRPTRRRRPDVSSMPPRRGGSVRSGGFCEPECMERYEPSAWAKRRRPTSRWRAGHGVVRVLQCREVLELTVLVIRPSLP